jgi:hypothetical protein
MEVIDFFSRSCDRMLCIKIEEEEITTPRPGITTNDYMPNKRDLEHNLA